MNIRNDRYVFTSEAVSEGHPDKVCDQIADSVLDAALKTNPNAHVACEVLATTDLVVLAGEINPADMAIDCDGIVRQTVDYIGYNRPGVGFDCHTLRVENHLHNQSQDIAMGVNSDTSFNGEQGAGDQGIMFGYACDETPAYLAAPHYYAQQVMQRMAQLRHSQPEKYSFLLPDAKAQFSIAYENDRPAEAVRVVVSHQHTEGNNPRVHETVKEVLKATLPEALLSKIDFAHENTPGASLLINPTGNFVTGGPDGDTGVTGRKIIVDTYGGMGRHGGGAFSGKDPSKVDRSAAYMARHVAKNLVAAGVARRCEIQVAYAIGVSEPLAFHVEFFGTGAVPEAKVEALLMSGKPVDFRPAQITARLGLTRPQGWSYRQTAVYGHFGRDLFPWERLDLVEDFRRALA